MAWVGFQSLAPSGKYFERAKGKEIILVAGSLKQCRIVFKGVRRGLKGQDGFSYSDNNQELAITSKDNGTKLIGHACNARTSLGWGDESSFLVLADEPAAWPEREGAALFSSISTALGKPGADLRIVMAGTRAPARPGNWWYDLLDAGSFGSTFVMMFDAEPDKGLSLARVRWANPVMYAFAESRQHLKNERLAALKDERKRSDFCSFRMNSPIGDFTSHLLTIPQWNRVLERPVSDRGGELVIAFDLGASRAWSSAVGIWEAGRVEAVAMVGGIPDIADREKADGVEAGTYARLVAQGRLIVIEGKRLPLPADLVGLVADSFGNPDVIKCDKFKLAELQDSCDLAGYELEPRWMRHSESTEDIGALRSLALDGDLAIEETSRALLSVSMAAAMVSGDDMGSVRMVKKGDKSSGRDDVAVAMVLAAGEVHRRRQKPKSEIPPWVSPRVRDVGLESGPTGPGRIVNLN